MEHVTLIETLAGIGLMLSLWAIGMVKAHRISKAKAK